MSHLNRPNYLKITCISASWRDLEQTLNLTFCVPLLLEITLFAECIFALAVEFISILTEREIQKMTLFARVVMMVREWALTTSSPGEQKNRLMVDLISFENSTTAFVLMKTFIWLVLIFKFYTRIQAGLDSNLLNSCCN